MKTTHSSLPGQLLAVLAFNAGLGALQAAPTYSTDFNPGSTTDRFDLSQGVQVIDASPILGFGGESLGEAFGGSGGIENGNVILSDGPPLGTVDRFDWQTPGWVNVSGIEIRLAQDGAAAFRGANAYTLYTTQDGLNFSTVSSGSIPLTGGPGSPMVNSPLLISDLALAGSVTNVRGFRLEITRNSAGGTRVIEIDDIASTPGVQTMNYHDKVAFNAATNSLVTTGAPLDEGPGLGFNYSVSSAVAGGTDTVVDAFGNKDGAVEPESFIFGDGGTADNGNLVLGDGGETVDFIQWQSSAPLTLAGFKINLAGDGGGNPDRDTELVRFLVEGTEVDLFDNNGFDGEVARLFSGGAVTGDDFRLEFSRRTGQGGRVFEIDAILGMIPEPGSAALVALAGVMLLRRRRQTY
ncbi:MAG: PEP-CTERM sorting domain-containing protein [Verrucomicrobiales bacterium]|nr:PEP-CTERM sorting domain-containing protein [Verrucomicrobiales bacterium]